MHVRTGYTSGGRSPDVAGISRAAARRQAPALHSAGLPRVVVMAGLFWILVGCPLADARSACEEASYNDPERQLNAYLETKPERRERSARQRLPGWCQDNGAEKLGRGALAPALIRVSAGSSTGTGPCARSHKGKLQIPWAALR